MLEPLLASAGVAGVALGLAAQTRRNVKAAASF